ncbi:ferric-chelate reductase 1-like [Montipora capricornis]|uniref:ferric-chelate reductase 1-like n=1 Tax=Montipora capricornis TaxID=246305 RepID=UPI0035F13F3E
MGHIRIFTSDMVAVLLAVLFSQGCASGTRLSSKSNTGHQLQSFSGDDCGKTKGCYFKPESCNNSPNDCDYFVSYTPKGSSFSFELSGKEKWIAVGFNYKPTMDSTDGFICSALPNGSLLFGHYPLIGHKTPIRTKKVIKELKLENISQEGGVIKCRFSRQKTSSMMAVDLNKDLYLIFASGPVEKDGTLYEHRWFSHSMSPVNLEEIEILEASPYDLIVIQLHAVLLVFAWVGFATMGMFIARFMKPVWGEKEICSKRIWFVVHITIMLLTALLTIFGTSLAFLYVGSWSEDAGAHPFIGVIVLVIAVLQPLIAFFRPPVNAGRRRVLFNWVHRAVGLIALSLAVTNIFLGCLLPAFHLENSAVYVMLVYLLAIAGIVSFELYLTLCTKSDIDDFRVLSRPEDDEVEVALTPRRHNTGDIRKRWRLHNFVFGLLILVIIIVCLAMAVLLAGHEEADNDENDD